ncbi:MAG TPA: STAS domain-containing protein [Ilumatobacteraceae bacterium]|jgi:anti-anti-sigma factor
MHDLLHVDVSGLNGTIVLAVHGEIDAASAPLLESAFEDLTGGAPVLVDMSGVSFMDSSGLHTLLTQTLRIREDDGTIHICNPSDAVQRVVELTGLGEFFYEPDSTS